MLIFTFPAHKIFSSQIDIYLSKTTYLCIINSLKTKNDRKKTDYYKVLLKEFKKKKEKKYQRNTTKRHVGCNL